LYVSKRPSVNVMIFATERRSGCTGGGVVAAWWRRGGGVVAGRRRARGGGVPLRVVRGGGVVAADYCVGRGKLVRGVVVAWYSSRALLIQRPRSRMRVRWLGWVEANSGGALPPEALAMRSQNGILAAGS
jgi:hypothetical protein